MHGRRVGPLYLTLLCALAACGRAPAGPPPAASLPAGFGAALTAEVGGDPRPGLSAQAAACPTQLAVPYDARTLDTGLYWYGPSEPGAPGGVGCKARPDGGALSGYYDPAKPTLIFVHGWQNGSVQQGRLAGTSQSNKRDSFYFKEGGFDAADAWIARGWNVGIYQWTQLADDEGTLETPYHAQAKIWTADYGYTDVLGRWQDIRMRYRVTGGGYRSADMPTQPAGALFYQAYKSAMAQSRYGGPEGVRIVGHSLGAQMALSLLAQADADPGLPARLRPNRLVLADPYWTPASPAYGHSYAYLAPDANPAERARRIVAALRPSGVAVEWLKTSRVNDLGGDNNDALAPLVSRTEVFPDYVLDLDLAMGLARKHNVAPRWYLASAQFAPGGAVSASNDQGRALAVMRAGSRFEQDQGRWSVGVGDDRFVAVPNP